MCIRDRHYIVDDYYDQVIESEDVAAGIDTVKASVSYTLSSGVENLILLGNDSLSGGGNDLNNNITGTGGGDFLSGYAGNDTILGMDGNDYVDGGSGDDRLEGNQGNDYLMVAMVITPMSIIQAKMLFKIKNIL